MKKNSIEPAAPAITPPATVATRIAQRNGQTDVTKRLGKVTPKVPPAALPPKKKP